MKVSVGIIFWERSIDILYIGLGCIIKEAVANKKRYDIDLPLFWGQFYDKTCGLVSWLVAQYWWETFFQYIAKVWVLIKKRNFSI